MNATKWHRRAGADPYYTGDISVALYGTKEKEIHLNLTSISGDDVDRLGIHLTIEEATELCNSLTRILFDHLRREREPR